MKKTEILSVGQGKAYVWGTAEYGYTLYLKLSEKTASLLESSPAQKEYARSAKLLVQAKTYSFDPANPDFSAFKKTAKGLLQYAVRGQFKIVPSTTEQGKYHLQFRRFVPKAVRDAYRAKKQAEIASQIHLD